MKLKKYLEDLNALVNSNPGALEMEVITAGDDEGNFFNPVVFSPALGSYHGQEFTEAAALEDGDEINTVCLN